MTIKYNVSDLYRSPTGEYYGLARVTDDSRRAGYQAILVTIDDTTAWDEPTRLASEAVSGLTRVGSDLEVSV